MAVFSSNNGMFINEYESSLNHKRVKGLEFDLEKHATSARMKKAIKQNPTADQLSSSQGNTKMSTTSTGVDLIDSQVKSRIESFDKEKAKLILESSDIVKEYNLWIDANLDAIIDAKYYSYGEGTAVMVAKDLKATLEAANFSRDEIKNYLKGTFFYTDNDPEKIRKLLEARLKYNKKITSMLNDMIKKNYAILGLTESEMDTISKQLSSDGNESGSGILSIKKAIINNRSKFLINDGECLDLSSLGFGKIYLTKGNDFLGSNFMDAPHIDPENPNAIHAIDGLLQKAMVYDAIVMCHGGSANNLKMKYIMNQKGSGYDKAKGNLDPNNKKNLLNRKRWVIQPLRTESSSYFIDMNSFLMQLIREGKKKILIAACNPGSHPVDKSLLKIPGVKIMYSDYSNLIENAEDNNVYEYDLCSEMDFMLFEGEQDLIAFAESCGVSYYENFDMDIDNYILNEGVIDTLKEFATNVVKFIIGLFKSLWEVIKKVFTKLKERFSNKKLDTKDKKVDLSIIVAEASVKEYKISNDKELKSIVVKSCNSLQKEIKKRQDIQNRATKQLASVTNRLKEGSTESAVEEEVDIKSNPSSIKLNSVIKRTSKPAKNQKTHLNYLKQKQKNKTNAATDQSEIPHPSRLTEEAIYNNTYKYPVFITLMHSGTPLANAIKFVTRDEFSHACISFNSKLDPLYSFGSKKVGGFDLGLVSHNNNADFYKKFKAHYRVYVLFVDKRSLDAMKSRLKWFINNSDKLKYDFKGLFDIWFNKSSDDREYKYFCSRFVADVLKYSGKGLDKLPSLYTPQDLSDLYYISLVNGGDDFSKYNYKNTERNIDSIKNGIYDDIMFSEALRLGLDNEAPLYNTVLETLSSKERSLIPENRFGIPMERKFPLDNKDHALSAIKLFNKVEPKYEKQLAGNIKKAMKKYGIDNSKVGKNNRLRKYLNESSIMEDSTTANTIVGPNSNPDSVYVVNYLKNNAFNRADSKFGIAIDKSLSNIFYYNDDTYSLDKTTLEGLKENNKILGVYSPNYDYTFDSIIKEMVDNEGITNNLLFSNSLVKEASLDRSYRFTRENTILDDIKVIDECIKASYKKINEYSLPYLPYLIESFNEYNNYNYYTDKDGIFIMNESKLLRSKSYNDIKDIPSSVFRYISLGHL